MTSETTDTTDRTTAHEATEGASEHRTPQAVNRNVVLATLVSGAFIVILNQTLLNTALPAFMREFGITAISAQWVTTTFMLVNGIMIPVTAFLIQKFSTRTLFFTAMGLFTVGTLVCAVAPVYPVLLLGRVIQAAGGGIIMPLMQTILFAVFPVDKRGTAMGTFGLVIAFAPAIGPSLSGWIVDHLPWQTLFLMMLPIAVIDMIVAFFILRNVTERTFPRLDVLSIILSTFAFGGLLFGLGNAGNSGWTSAQALAPLVIGALTLVWFVHRQLRLPEPILEFRVLRYRMFTLGTVLGMLVFMAMIGGMLLIPLYMQNMVGYTAMESGLVLLPGAVVMGLMSPVTGRIFDRFGATVLATVGFTLVTVTTFMFAVLSTETSLVYIAVVNAVRMFGTAMVIMPVTTAALNQLPPHLIPHGTALNNTLRQVAASVGTAVLVTVMAEAARDPEKYGMAGQIHGVNVAFLVAGAIGALGVIGALFLRGTKPPKVETVPSAVEGAAAS
ncbi:DHA2 family efflux MFS transporter permease subunit [Brachybacterium sacelli]|uniref:EmrB/QacA subfamily drug resistance transporter n=1 Tax=Brachybacterium sacelli TaxID=173364 RepID=A0ABS4X6L8_9MICO|nr:DHA2 family efflux MFS transporter permease subunit [Brachybacterium sacelli]MBP2383364.1 EmrB/QacA subfamily drug resistance transporter [Brachybacterium sacelli]